MRLCDTLKLLNLNVLRKIRNREPWTSSCCWPFESQVIYVLMSPKQLTRVSAKWQKKVHPLLIPLLLGRWSMLTLCSRFILHKIVGLTTEQQSLSFHLLMPFWTFPETLFKFVTSCLHCTYYTSLNIELSKVLQHQTIDPK